MDGTAELDRFVQAQEGQYQRALAELRSGRKTGHWIWFVLPQLRGLGRSSMAQQYGIASASEAKAYLAHPVLGPRLFECLDALLAADGSAEHILGSIDAMKVRSCVTLFSQVSDDARLGAVLDRFYDGQPDPLTLGALGDTGRVQ